MRKPKQKVKSPVEARKLRRKLSVRTVVSGTMEKPRICVTKSNANIRVQVVDDTINKVLFSVETYGKNGVSARANKDGARIVGQKVALFMKERGISTGVFDRNGNLYTGVVAAVANAIRESDVRL